MFLSSRNTGWAVLLRYMIKYIEKKPTVAQHIFEESCSYTKTPIPCVVDLRKLLKRVKQNLAAIRTPIFIAQGENSMLFDEEKEQVYDDIRRFVMTVLYQEESGAESDKGLVFS